MGRFDMPVSLPTLGLVWNRRGGGCSSTRPEPLWRWSLQESCAGTWPGGGNAELETRVTSPCTILRTGRSFPCTDDSSWSASKVITPPACPSVCKVINSLHWCDAWCCRWQCVVLCFFFRLTTVWLNQSTLSTKLCNDLFNTWGVFWTSWWCCSIWLELKFFHSNWSDGNGSETQKKKQIGMWGSERLWLNSA